jgi:hypothetical protein
MWTHWPQTKNMLVITWVQTTNCNQKERGSRNLTTQILSSMDPDIHAPQIDPTPTGTSASPGFELASFSLWSSTTQRLTYTTTQQSHHIHLLSDTSTLMQCRKKILMSYSQVMYISENTSISLPFKSTQGKIWQFLGLAIFSAPLLNSSPLSFCNRSSTIHQMQRKNL